MSGQRERSCNQAATSSMLAIARILRQSRDPSPASPPLLTPQHHAPQGVHGVQRICGALRPNKAQHRQRLDSRHARGRAAPRQDQRLQHTLRLQAGVGRGSVAGA